MRSLLWLHIEANVLTVFKIRMRIFWAEQSGLRLVQLLTVERSMDRLVQKNIKQKWGEGRKV